MQRKWKCIITNWINCYFNKNINKSEISVNRESLLNIISHLRENFNLDESKSSIFIGHSLEEFILEKYPGFQFENGTVEVLNEEETYIAASLLLFFVCVNSKDVDFKNAMCSKLSTSDQEVILKFSKSLMVCSSISSSDVIAAIAEACGPDMANGEGACGSVMVAETPPALRSLHSEVRRLQAALDAERFDRNYLQDELARTNVKLEKLSKDKEQYKLDIVNLKSKISMCCGQEAEARDSVTISNESSKLKKQLEQMEQRVIDVQEQLEEVQHERDTFKTKMEDLKGECDRLLAFNLQETSRASELAEELESEKRQSQSLRELVLELRQHNHRNELNSWSQLECDDLDTSVQSLQRSFSGCSEVCANVVEVQLGEERAKSVALKQQFQILQDQMNEQLQKAESFKEIISDKDNDILNLKHRINEEIEEKNNLKNYFDYEVMKLNNLRNELEQKIKDNSEHFRLVNEMKMQEIQTLQEEKLSLLQSLSDETTKLENLIKDLRIDIDVEKTLKMKLREDYEIKLMKMKEKVLNRNNELVELQNKILQKGEIIEQLSLELRKERELKDETICKYNSDMSLLNTQKISIERDLQNKVVEIAGLLNQIQQRDASIEDMAKDIEHLKITTTKLKEEYKILQATKQTLLDDIQNRQISAEKMRKELENLIKKHTEEKNKLKCKLDEMCAMVKSLQTQLQNEIDFKMGLQQELENSQGVNTELSNTNTKLNTELSEITVKILEKDEVIKEKELMNTELSNTNTKLNTELSEITVKILEKDEVIKEKELMNTELSNTNTKLNTELSEITVKILEKDEVIKEKELMNTELSNTNTKLNTELSENTVKILEKDEVIKEKELMNTELSNTNTKLNTELSKITVKILEKDEVIKEKELMNTELSNTNTKLNTELSEITVKILEKDEVIKEKELMNTELSNTNTKLNTELSKITVKILEKDEVIKEKELVLHQEQDTYLTLKEESDQQKIDINQLTNQVIEKDKKIQDYENTLQLLNKSFQEEVSNKMKIIDSLNKDLAGANTLNQTLKGSCNSLSEENAKLVKQFIDKCNFISQLELERENLSQKMEEKGETINTLEQMLNDKMLAFIQIENNFGIEISKLVTKLSETEKTLKEIKTKSNSIIGNQESQIKKLNADIFILQGKIETGSKEKVILENEKENLVQKLKEVTVTNNKIEKDYEYNCKDLQEIIDSLKQEIVMKCKEIDNLKRKTTLLSSSVEEKENELSVLQDRNNEWKTKTDIMGDYYGKEKEKLQKDLEEFINNNELLKVESTENLQTIYKLEEKLKACERNIVTLEQKRKVHETLMSELKMERNELFDKKINLETERDKLIAQTNEFESNFEVLKKELNDVKRELINLQNDKLELLNIIENNKSEIFKLERNIQSQLDEKVKICQTFEGLNKLLVCLNVELCRLQEELTSNNNRINVLEKVITEWEKFLIVREKERKYFENEKDNLVKEKNSYLKQICNLEEEIKVLQNEDLPKLKKDNVHLTKIVEENKNVTLSFKQLINHEQEQNSKLRQNFESEKINITNKCSLLQENLAKAEQNLENHSMKINKLQEEIDVYSTKAKESADLKRNSEMLFKINEEQNIKLRQLTHELEKERLAILQYEKVIESKEVMICELKQRLDETENEKKDFDVVRKENKQYMERIRRKEEECAALKSENDELKIKKDTLEIEFKSENNALQNELRVQIENNNKLEIDVQLHVEKLQEEIKAHDSTIRELQEYRKIQNTLVRNLEEEIIDLKNEKEVLERENHILIVEKNDYVTKLNILQTEFDVLQNEELTKLKEEHLYLTNVIEKNESVITMLEKQLQQNERLYKDNDEKKLKLIQKCNVLEARVEERNMEINALKEEFKLVTSDAKSQTGDLKHKDEVLTKIIEQKDAIIAKISEELSKEKLLNEEYQKQVELQEKTIYELKQKLEKLKNEAEMMDVIRRENMQLVKQIESNAVSCQEKYPGQQFCSPVENIQQQVDNISSTNHTHSSMDSNKTITDLERILNDKNRTITTLQSDITFLKSLMAESENKVLDVSKELEISRENCQQLSNQLKKIVYQKNEEIMDLKRQVTKMSATENRASQIIKVSAKYQEIIHKRIAEIKSNTVLKELTNFGNTANCDSDLKRSLNAGAITMEDLENFLETTDRHLRRCSEKRVTLQKERDRLMEVNRINESEIINIRKFLTELSVSVKTFNSVREIYTQKLSRIVSLQRTVRREVLSVEGRLTDATMCKLERGYAAVMQDLAECVMNLERWVERTIGRAISAEKINQAFTTENERVSLAPASFQNAGLEVQMEELENNFQKLLEEVVRAQKGDGARDAQSLTVKEVRAEYEDKLTRMKAKMKDLYYEQIEVFKNKQREEINMLEQELQKTRDKLQESSQAYEEHISSLSMELWKLGEKFLDKKDEAEWLRRKQRSESLMSLQHVHSTGLATQPEETSRASDTHSLRSLPVNINKKREGRGLHMSDEEGEVFDNRHLRELRSPQRLSELRWRNSLCPPHLKSSYPAETQFAHALHEDDIKSGPPNVSVGARQQRKEVGITAYKKPGPPTPSKQAGRLSATDSELRESLRLEAERQASRKTATPSRLRSFFGTAKNDTVEGTPRSRRLSNFFRKK